MSGYCKVGRKSRGGFLQRTAAAVALCVLSGLLLIIPGVSSDDAAPAANTPAYSHWQAQRAAGDDDTAAELSDETDSIRVGSFKLTRPRSELFMSGLSDEWVRIISSAAVEQEDIEKYLSDRARKQVMDSEGQQPQFRDWLMQRREGIENKLLVASADYATEYLTAAASDSASGLSFIRTIEWDYQSALGDRRWQSGLSALGALRESDDGAIVWQLRAYAAEEDSTGANAGLIYRHVGDAAGRGLVGVNAFLDYEKHGDYDESFLRWSVGGEYRSTLLDLYFNRYFPISDAVADGNDYIYTQGGYDAQANLSVADFGLGDLSGGLTYYLWEGEYGDDDDRGFRYHVRFSPARGNLRLELELDSPDGGDAELGGNISYRYTVGSAISGGSSESSGATFDARAHFFDSVRREYAQRIRRSGEGGANLITVIAVSGESTVQVIDGSTDPVSLVTLVALEKPAGSEGETLSYESTYNASITTEADSTLSVIASDWTMEVYKETHISLLMSSSVVRLVTGTVSIDRNGDGLDSILINNPDPNDPDQDFNITITLLGTRMVVGRESDNHPESGLRNMELTLQEGTILLSLANSQEGYIDIEGVSATAIVESVLDSLNNPDIVSTLTLGCASPRQRNDHKLLDGVYNGCAGDAYLILAAGETVYIRTQSDEEITLVGLARGLGVDISVYNSAESTVKWGAGYPFYPPGASVRTDTAPVQISYTGDDGMTATVSLAVSTTVQLSREAPDDPDDMRPMINVAVRGGTVSVVGATDDNISCSGDERDGQTQNGINIVAACGEMVTFDGGHTVTVLSGRAGVGREHQLPLTGGDGNYTFSLVSPPGDALALVNATGAIAVLSLSSNIELNNVVFRLHAAPLDEVIRRHVSAVTLEITLNVKEKFSAQAPSSAATVRTLLDGGDVDLLLRGLIFPGQIGVVTYEIDSTAPAGLQDNFVVIADDSGNARVSLVTPLTDAQEIAVVIEGTDDDGTEQVAATVTLTVDARHPGAITTAVPDISSDVIVNDHALYDMAERGVLAEISEVGNEGLSGISDSYTYALVGDGNLFQITPAAAPAESANLRVINPFTQASLPAGAYTLTVSINDQHTATPALDLVFSISIVTPLALVASNYEVNINSSERNAVLATVTVVTDTGAPPYTYRVGGVEPSDVPANLFAVGRDNAGNGTINFVGAASYNDTELATVNIIVEDALNGASQTFILSVSIFAPLNSSPSPQQVIHQSHRADFYTLSGINGGSPPYTYNLMGILTADGFVAADFAIGSANGNVSAAGDLSGKSGIATLRFGITDNIGTAINDYRLTVTVSDSNIEYDPTEVEVKINLGDTGVISNEQAGWSGANHGAFSYRVADVMPAGDAGKISVDPISGALNLNQIVARVGDTITVKIEAAENADNVTGFPPATLEVEFTEVGAIAASGITSSFATDDTISSREIVRLSVSSGGSGGAYQYSINSQNPANHNILAVTRVDDNGVSKGVVTQTRIVNTEMTITTVVRITDTDARVGSMVDVPIVVSWSEIPLVQPDAQLVVIGGTLTALTSDVWASFGGEVWEERTAAAAFPARRGHAAAVLNNTIYISGGTGSGNTRLGDVWSSTDGISWSQSGTGALGARQNHAMLTLAGSLRIVGGLNASGGYIRNTRSSADGVTWENSTQVFPSGEGRSQMAAAVHGGTIFIIGGFGGVTNVGNDPIIYDEVWYSTDGTSWTEHSVAPNLGGEGGRYGAQAVSFNNELYVIGGQNFVDGRASSLETQSDVWKSSDGGATWQEVTDNAGLGAIRNHIALVQGQKMFVIGGESGGSDTDDVYSSSDGENWTLETNAPGFGNRFGFAAAVFTQPVGLRGPTEEPLVRIQSVHDAPDALLTLTASGGGRAGDTAYQYALASPAELVNLVNIDNSTGEVSDNGLVANLAARAATVVVEWTVTETLGTLNTPARTSTTLTVISQVKGAAAEIVLSEEFSTEDRQLLVLSEITGGVPPYTYVNAGVNPPGDAGLVELSTDTPPVLMQIDPVNTAKGITVTIEVSDTAAGGGANTTATIEVAINWAAVTPTPVAGNFYALGGEDTSGVNPRAYIYDSATYDHENTGLTRINPLNGFPAIFDHAAAVFNQRMYIAGGRDGESNLLSAAWSSVDGRHWRRLAGEVFGAGASGREGIAMLAYNTSLYIAGGADGSEDYNEVFRLENSGSWTKLETGAKFPARTGHAMLAHNSTMFIIGGYNAADTAFLSDVWSSTDGDSWTLTADAPFSGRRNASAVSYKGKIYLIGGETSGNSDSNVREVWSSADGVWWRRETGAAAFPASETQRALAAGEQILLLNTAGEMWASTNGREWARAADDEGNVVQLVFTERDSFAAAVFNPTLPPFSFSAPAKAALTEQQHGNNNTPLLTLAAENGVTPYAYEIMSVNPDSLAAQINIIQSSIAANQGIVESLRASDGEAEVVWKATDDSGNGITLLATTTLTVLAGPLAVREETITLTQNINTPAGRQLGVLNEIVRSGAEESYEFRIDSVTPNSKAGYVALNAGDDTILQQAALVSSADAVLVSVEVYDGNTRVTVNVSLVWETPRTPDDVAGQIGLLGGNTTGGALVNDSWRSADGASWARVASAVEFSAREDHAVAVANGTIYVSGGRDVTQLGTEDVWTSEGGISWTQAADDAEFADGPSGAGSFGQAHHQMLALPPETVGETNTLIVIGGINSETFDDYGNVWSSNDGGETWTPAAAVPESVRDHAAALHDGTVFVIGGAGAAVWKRENNGSWTRIVRAAPFGALRYGSALLSFNGRLYVIGGSTAAFIDNNTSGSNFLSDVWSSADGVIWRLETDAAAFGRLATHAAVVLGREMLVIGGTGAGTDGTRFNYTNKVWASGDGVTWTEKTSASPLSARRSHAAFVFDPPAIPVKTEITTALTLRQDTGLTNGAELAVFGNVISGGEIGSNIVYSFEGTAPAQAILDGDVLKQSGNVAAGSYNTKVKVTDGNTAVTITVQMIWTDPTTPVTAAVAGDLFAIGGGGNTQRNGVDVSRGGADDWSVLDQSANNQFPARWQHAAAVLNGRVYIAAGASGNTQLADVWHSTNGQNWLRFGTDTHIFDSADPVREQIAMVAYDNNLYISGGYNGTDAYNDVFSSDGDIVAAAANNDWTKSASGVKFSARYGHQMLVHDNRMFIIGGSAAAADSYLSDVWESQDGNEWTRVTEAPFDGRRDFAAVSYNGRIYVIGGGESAAASPLQDVWSSADGRVWRQDASGVSALADVATPRALVQGSDAQDGARIVLLNEDGTAHWSRNGRGWTLQSDGDGTGLNNISHFAAVVFSPPPPLALTAPEKVIIDHTDVGDSTAVGRELLTLSAANGTPPYTYAVSMITSSDNSIVANDLEILISERTSLVFNEGFAEKLRTANVEATVTWEVTDAAGIKASAKTTLSPPGDLGGDLFVIGGNDSSNPISRIWKSSNGGASWDELTQTTAFPIRSLHGAAVLNGTMYIAGGYGASQPFKSNVQYSVDGLVWRDASTETFHPGVKMVAYKGKLYIAGGQDFGGGANGIDTVYSSADGVTWAELTVSGRTPADRVTSGTRFSPRFDHAMVVHNNTMFIIGGRGENAGGSGQDSYRNPTYSEVLWSTDGDIWTALPDGGLPPRRRMGVASFNGRIYVVGGDTNNQGARDLKVWYSADGATWAEQTGVTFEGSPNPTDIFNPQLIVRGAEMLLIMQTNGKVFSTTDGKKWDEKGDLVLNLPGVQDEGTLFNQRAVYLTIPPLNLSAPATLTLTEDHVDDDVDNPPTVPLLTLSGGGGARGYTYELISVDPSSLMLSLELDTTSGEVIDNGIAVLLRAATTPDDSSATVIWGVTDTDGDTARAATTLTIARVPLAFSEQQVALTQEFPSAINRQLAVLSNIASGGIGQIRYRIKAGASARANAVLALTEDGVLSQKIPVNAAETFNVMVEAFTATETAEVELQLSWAQRDITAVDADADLLIMGGFAGGSESNNVYRLDDSGASWESVTQAGSGFRVRHRAAAAVLGDTIYLAAGDGGTGALNDVWSSTDGVNWTERQAISGATWSTRRYAGMVAYDNPSDNTDDSTGGKLYISGGLDDDGTGIFDDVWSSADGITWVEEDGGTVTKFTARASHEMLVHGSGNDRKMFIIGGVPGNPLSFTGERLSDVWESTDGDDWTRVTDAPFDGRDDFAAVSFNSRIFVIGGRTASNTYARDVWSSADGLVWRQETAAMILNDDNDTLVTPPPALENLRAVVRGEEMFLVADNDGFAYTSSDGITWTRTADSFADPRPIDYAVVAHTQPPPAVALAHARDEGEAFVYTLRQTINTADGTQLGVLNTVVKDGTGNYTYSIDGILRTGNAPSTPEVVINGNVLMQGSVVDAAKTITATIVVDDRFTQVKVQVALEWVAGGTANIPAVNEGTDLYVVGGDNGEDEDVSDRVYKSTDGGDNWARVDDTTVVDFPVRYFHSAAAFNGRIFIAGGFGSSGTRTDVWSSADGISWTESTASAFTPGLFGIRMVSYQKPSESQASLYIAGGSSQGTGGALNSVYVSADGETWRGLATGTAENNTRFTARRIHEMLVHGSGDNRKMFIIGGRNTGREYLSDVWSSTDGDIWTLVTDAPFVGREQFAAVSFNGRIFIIGGQTTGEINVTDVWSSADGILWRRETDEMTFNSSDGSAVSPVPALVYHRAVVRGKEMLLIADNGYYAYSSTDGITWERKDNPFIASGFRANYAVAALTPPLLVSKEQVTLTQETSDTITNRELAVFSNIVSGGSGKITYDFAGVLSARADAVLALTEAGVLSQKIAVGVGAGETILATVEAASGDRRAPITLELVWADRDIPEVNPAADLFIIGGDDGEFAGYRDSVYKSTDGDSWARVDDTAVVDFPVRSFHGVAVFNGRIYIAGGSSSGANRTDVWSSADGVSWTESAASAFDPGLFGVKMVSYQKPSETQTSLYIAGGSSNGISGVVNSVYVSADGVSWGELDTGSRFTARRSHEMLVHDDKMFIIGGRNTAGDYLSDVWSSTDGNEWTPVTDAPFAGRGKFAAVSFNDRIFVIGGFIGQDQSTDVWSSADGFVWRQETAAAGFGVQIVHHRVVVRGEEMLLIADDNGYAYSSSDGITWTRKAAAFATDVANYAVAAFTPPPVLSKKRIALTQEIPSADGSQLAVLSNIASGGKGAITYRFKSGTPASVTDLLALTEAGVLSQIMDVNEAQGINVTVEAVAAGQPAEISLTLDWAAPMSTAVAGDLVAMGGNSSVNHRVHVSRNGTAAWEELSERGFHARWKHAAAVFNNAIWIVHGGSSSDSFAAREGIGTGTWSSTDGVSWTEVRSDIYGGGSPRGRMQIGVVAYIKPSESQASLYISGGINPSTDIVFDEVHSYAGGNNVVALNTQGAINPPARYGHAMLVHNNTMFIIGGSHAPDAYFSDVWSSQDGDNWTLVTEAAPFPARRNFAAVSYHGRIFVMGGGKSAAQDPLQDVWSSADGLVWRLDASDVAELAHARTPLALVQGGNAEGGARIMLLSDLGSAHWTRNGRDWTQQSTSTGLNNDQHFAAVVYRLAPTTPLAKARAETFTLTQAISFPATRQIAALDVLVKDGSGDYVYTVDGINRGTRSAPASGPEEVTINAGSNALVQGSVVAEAATITATIEIDDGFTQVKVEVELEWADVDTPEVNAGTDLFIIGGDNGNETYNGILESESFGLTWKDKTTPSFVNQLSAHNAAVLSNTIYVAGGFGNNDNNNNVWASSDGQSWNMSAANPFNHRFGRYGMVAYSSDPGTTGNSLYIAGGRGAGTSILNEVWASANGADWSPLTGAKFTARSRHAMLVHNNTMFIIGGGTKAREDATGGFLSDVWSSTDGKVWATVAVAPFSARDEFAAVSYSGRIFVIGGRNAQGQVTDVWSSADGLVWRQETDAMIFNNSTGSAVTPSPTLSRTPKAVVRGTEMFLIADTAGYMYKSSDGITWTRTAANASGILNYFDFAAVLHTPPAPEESDGSIRLYPDAVFQGRQLAVFNDIEFASAGARTYEILSTNPSGHDGIFSFTDAEDSLVQTGATPNINPARVSVEVQVSSTGEQPIVLTLDITWGDQDPGNVHPNGQMLVIGGYEASESEYLNDVWSSADSSSTWDKLAQVQPFPARRNHVAAALEGLMYVTGGSDGRLKPDVWSSPDGRHWTQSAQSYDADFIGSRRNAMVAYNNTLFITGGDISDRKSNRVFAYQTSQTSASGREWNELLQGQKFIPRSDHAMLVHNDAMFILGGLVSAPAATLTDVWKSTDGVDWELVTNAPFGQYRRIAAVSFRNRIFIMASEPGADAEVWSSADGVYWRRDAQPAILNENGFTLFRALVRGGTMYALGQASNDNAAAYQSTNGRDWTKTAGFASAAEGRETFAAAVWTPQVHIIAPEILTLAQTAHDGNGVDLLTLTAAAGTPSYVYELESIEPSALAQGGNLLIKNELSDDGNNRVIGSILESTGIVTELSDTNVAPSGLATVVWRITDSSAPPAVVLFTVVLTVISPVAADNVRVQPNVPVAAGTQLAAVFPRGGKGDYNYSITGPSGIGTTLSISAGGELIQRIAVSTPQEIVVSVLAADGISSVTVDVTINWRTPPTPGTLPTTDGPMILMGGLAHTNNEGRQETNDVWESYDGATWQLIAPLGSASLPQRRRFHSAAAHNGNVYIVGGVLGSTFYNDVWSSANGVIWNRLSNALTNGASRGALVSFNNQLVFMGGIGSGDAVSEKFYTSPDGRAWTEVGTNAFPKLYAFSAATLNNTIYVIGGRTTDDQGDNVNENDVWAWGGSGAWTDIGTVPGTETGQMENSLVSFDDKLYFVFNGRVWSSTDGVDWDQIVTNPASIPGVNNVHALLVREGTLYLTDDTNVWSSADGVTWNEQTGAAYSKGVPYANFNRRRHNAATFGPQHIALTTPAQPVRLPYPAAVESTIYTFYANGGGAANRAAYRYALAADTPAAVSDNIGIDANTGRLTVKVRLEQETVVALTVLVSIEGMPANVVATAAITMIWEAEPPAANPNMHMVAIGGGTGNTGNAVRFDEVVSSFDGVTWRTLTDAPGFAPRRRHAAAVLNGTIYVSGGVIHDNGATSNEVWASAGGVGWRHINRGETVLPLIDGHAMIAHNGQLCILGGQINNANVDKVYTSPDGATWTDATPAEPTDRFSGRWDLQVIEHRGSLFIIGGNNAGMYVSDSCGGSWTRLALAGIGTRTIDDHALASLGGTLYLIGGEDTGDNGMENEVWASVDGDIWTRVTGSTPAEFRRHAAVVKDSRIYVMGGVSGPTVWSSADGITWRKETDDWNHPGGNNVLWPAAVIVEELPLRLNTPVRVTLNASAVPGNVLFTLSGAGGVPDYTYALAAENTQLEVNAANGEVTDRDLVAILADPTRDSRSTVIVFRITDSANVVVEKRILLTLPPQDTGFHWQSPLPAPAPAPIPLSVLPPPAAPPRNEEPFTALKTALASLTRPPINI